MKKLTAKQQTFVGEYLIDLNATQAAIRAGYSKKTAQWIGPQLLSKTHVSAAVQEAIKMRSAKTEIKADDVLHDLREIADVCLGRKSTTITKKGIDGDGEEYEEKSEVTRFNPSAAIKALETIGRHLDMFVEPERGDNSIALFVAGVREFITQNEKQVHEVPAPQAIEHED